MAADLGFGPNWKVPNLWGDTLEKAMKETNEAVLEADKKDLSEVIKIRNQDNKYYLAGEELDINHLEDWGERIVAEMAKRMLRK